MKIKNLGKNKRGSSLIEVFMASVILAVVIIGIIGFFTKCSIFASDLRQHSIVNNVLNERMEQIRGMDYAAVLNLGSTFTAASLGVLNNAAGVLILDDPFSDSDIRRITLTVSWTTGQGRNLSKSMAAYVNNGGIH